MSDRPTILVVEDEQRQRDTLVRHLTRDGFDVVDAASGEAAFEELGKRTFQGLVTDLRLPGASGIDVVRRAHEYDEQLPAIVMTAFASVDTAVDALRAGAHDYILKPLFFEELSRKLRRGIEHRELMRENTRLRSALREVGDGAPSFVGDTPAAHRVVDWIKRASKIDSIVLITGETGTGKEIIARSIHEHGPHAKEPMLTVNVAALPENMVESELFGHEKGAFTGAQRQRDGILRAAGRGTVFLDEIGELPLDLQAKLLRALEAREVLPIGSDRPVSFEARIVCATHRDLRKLIADDKFREDLYYRLNVVQIDSPPLRERRDDIPGLAKHIIGKLAGRRGVEAPVIEPDAIRALCAYRWPGNVRELSNVLERAMIFADDGVIEASHLPVEIDGTDSSPSLELRDAVADFERRHIAKVLRQCDGNREQAASKLGLSPATLYRRLDRLDLKGDKAEGVRE